MPLKSFFASLAFAVCGAVFFAPSALAADTPNASADSVSQSDIFVRDQRGRIDYLVELTAEAPRAYERTLLHGPRFAAFHRPEVVNAVEDIEGYYGFTAHSITSFTVPTFTAFLDEAQVKRLRRDPRIAAINPNQRWDFSISAVSDTNAVWSNRIGAEVVSWGKVAVNSSATASNGNSIVYVLDAGVGQHEDLNVVERVNALHPEMDCGSRIGISCDSTILPNVVGCFTHATAVAGVIGALANGKGTQGINPGVQIVSVAASDSNLVSGATCLPVALDASAVAHALDWISSDLSRHPRPYTAVINLSANPAMNQPVIINGSTTTVTKMMNALANPASGHGAFIAQSAGNNYVNACTEAYNPPNSAMPSGFNGAALSNDGIMVVGAINNHGQAVVPFGSQMGTNLGFWKSSAIFGYAPGSNFGKCVDIWAPGDGIYMPVANPNSSIPNQNSTTIYRTYGMGSGTSFASPHVAGIASVLIEQRALTSPGNVEGAVRSVAYALGSVDTCNNNATASDGSSPGCATPLAIKMPSLNQLPANSASKPYGELSLETMDQNGRINLITVNGYPVCSDNPGYACSGHNYTGDPANTVTSYFSMLIGFGSSGGPCTVTRNTNLTTHITFINNQTQFFDAANWNSGTGSASTTWGVSSNCLPSFLLSSVGGSMKVAPNPVTIPAGQSSGQFTLSWDVTGYYPQGVTLYGKQNFGTNPNQILCLGSASTVTGSAPEGMVPGEIAYLWLTPNSNCIPGNVLPNTIIDSVKITTN